MAKDDFDMDFHFDDDDFDPKAFLDGEDGADIDLSEFDDVPSGDKPEETASDGYDDDLDLSDLGLDEDSDETVDDLDDILSPKAVRRNSQEHDDFGSEKQDNDPDFDVTDFLDEEDEQPQASPEDDSDFQDEPEDEDDYPQEEDEGKPDRSRKEKPEKAPKPRRERKPKAPKEAKPNIFTKLYDLYFAPLTNKEALELPADPANPRRRRRKTKAQIFKEVYLPPLIACVCLILILSFVIGSISNTIEKKRVNDAIKQNEIQASISSAEAAKAQYEQIMAEAAELAANYDYEGAIEKL
ncbi:MAG: hypothetical protein EGQ10_00845, partial [Clostridiales bacterium]|nr:hypothetical protein [Clostridiales bacterium]